MDNSKKIKCKCKKVAVWLYMPGDGTWGCCDNCVPRGCSCNDNQTEYVVNGKTFFDYPEDGNYGKEGKDWEWVDKLIWRCLDGKGRQLPCCEWWYCEGGWNKEYNRKEN